MSLSAHLHALLVLTLLAAPLTAQAPTANVPSGASATEHWSFELVPYFWAASLDGSIGIGNLPEADASASFADLLENLDWAASGFFTARKGPWVVYSDLSYAALAVEDSTAGSTVEIDSATYWAALAAGYTVFERDSRSVDVFAGARYMAVDNDAKSSGAVNASSGKKEDWLDPLVGFNARASLTERLGLGLLADFAGFGVGSDFTYEFMPTLSWRFGDTFSLRAGYRWLDTDFEDSDFSYDVVQAGWILGLGIGF